MVGHHGVISVCPCCGSSVDVRMPIVDLNTNHVVFGDCSVRVSPRMAEVMSYIASKHPRKVSIDDILYAVWSNVDPTPTDGLVRVYVTLLRHVLKRMGFTISSYIPNGYRLERVA